MRASRFPAEFADLLTPKGRRVLEGRDPATAGALAQTDRPFLALSGCIDRAFAAEIAAPLDRALYPHLVPLVRGIPPEAISGQTRNHQERLIKTVRARTAYFERRQSRAWRAAERLGLMRMMDSASYLRFAEILAGRALDRRFGRQILCYGAGDYAGPHTDHVPEDPRARGGYVDLHLSFSSPGVAQHLLVYAEGGHFRHVADVARSGTITAYRLPFWHYTTPLVVKRGHAQAHRWVVLGTFRFLAQAK